MTGLKEVRSLQNDLMFGLSQEDSVIEKLTVYFEDNIKSSKSLGLGHNCPYDAISFNTKYEIKSRRCGYKQYETTIVPVHKVTNITDRLIFVFHFTDGLYYIVYEEELFKTFEIKELKIWRRGINDKPTNHFYIPIQNLIKIEI